jgi:hypothetical protein
MRLNTGHLLLISIVFLSTGIPLDAQRAPPFLEAGAFSGGLLRPAGRRITGFELGVGKGKNEVGIEVSRDFLARFERGIGTTPDPNVGPTTAEFPSDYIDETRPSSQSPISGSTIESLGFHVRRDLHSFHGKVTAYGLLGIGYSKSRATESWGDSIYMTSAAFQATCGCNPASYGPVTFTILRTSQNAELSLGTGLRIPLSAGFGFRTELKALVTPTTGSNISSPGVVLLNPQGNPILFGQTPARVGYVSGAGARMKADVFLGITVGVYYRLVDRHL